jgi:hypothetical protein
MRRVLRAEVGIFLSRQRRRKAACPLSTPFLPVTLFWPTAGMCIQRTVASMNMEYSLSDAMILPVFFMGRLHPPTPSRAIASNSYKTQELSAVAIRRRGEDAAILDSALFRGLVEAKEIEDEATECGEIGPGIFLARASDHP